MVAIKTLAAIVRCRTLGILSPDQNLEGPLVRFGRIITNWSVRPRRNVVSIFLPGHDDRRQGDGVPDRGGLEWNIDTALPLQPA